MSFGRLETVPILGAEVSAPRYGPALVSARRLAVADPPGADQRFVITLDPGFRRGTFKGGGHGGYYASFLFHLRQ